MRLILLLLISDAYAYVCHANRVVHAFTPVVSRHVFCDIFTKDTWKPMETRGRGGVKNSHILIQHSAEFGVRLLLIKIRRNVRSAFGVYVIAYISA